MSRPTEINIMGKPFQITYCKKMPKNQYGETDGHARKIKIRAGLSTEQFEDTLLHETVHAILFVSGLSEMFEKETEEEAIVIALENGISQLYKRR